MPETASKPVEPQDVYRIEVSLSSQKTSAIVMATTAKLYSLEGDMDVEWKQLAFGVPCIQLQKRGGGGGGGGGSNAFPSHKLVIAELESGLVLWEGAIDSETNYQPMRANFHSFKASSKTYAMQFSSEEEATKLLLTMKDLTAPLTGGGGGGGEGEGVETIRIGGGSGSIRKTEHKSTHSSKSSKSGGRGSSGEGKASKQSVVRKISKKDISAPCDFKHVSGITLQRTAVCEEELKGTIRRKMTSEAEESKKQSVSGNSKHKGSLPKGNAEPTNHKVADKPPMNKKHSLLKMASMRFTGKRASSREGGLGDEGEEPVGGAIISRVDETRFSLPTRFRHKARPHISRVTFSTPQHSPQHDNTMATTTVATSNGSALGRPGVRQLSQSSDQLLTEVEKSRLEPRPPVMGDDVVHPLTDSLFNGSLEASSGYGASSHEKRAPMATTSDKTMVSSGCYGASTGNISGLRGTARHDIKAIPDQYKYVPYVEAKKGTQQTRGSGAELRGSGAELSGSGAELRGSRAEPQHPRGALLDTEDTFDGRVTDYPRRRANTEALGTASSSQHPSLPSHPPSHHLHHLPSDSHYAHPTSRPSPAALSSRDHPGMSSWQQQQQEPPTAKLPHTSNAQQIKNSLIHEGTNSIHRKSPEGAVQQNLPPLALEGAMKIQRVSPEGAAAVVQQQQQQHRGVPHFQVQQGGGEGQWEEPHYQVPSSIPVSSRPLKSQRGGGPATTTPAAFQPQQSYVTPVPHSPSKVKARHDHHHVSTTSAESHSVKLKQSDVSHTHYKEPSRSHTKDRSLSHSHTKDSSNALASRSHSTSDQHLQRAVTTTGHGSAPGNNKSPRHHRHPPGLHLKRSLSPEYDALEPSNSGSSQTESDDVIDDVIDDAIDGLDDVIVLPQDIATGSSSLPSSSSSAAGGGVPGSRDDPSASSDRHHKYNVLKPRLIAGAVAAHHSHPYPPPPSTSPQSSPGGASGSSSSGGGGSGTRLAERRMHKALEGFNGLLLPSPHHHTVTTGTTSTLSHYHTQHQHPPPPPHRSHAHHHHQALYTHHHNGHYLHHNTAAAPPPGHAPSFHPQPIRMQTTL